MRNAKLNIRCISDETLDTIIELLKEESNGIFIESWNTQEAPRTGGEAIVIYGADHDPGSGLGPRTRRNGGYTFDPRSRSRTGIHRSRQ